MGSPKSYAAAYAEAICPPPVMHMDEWADKYRRLSDKASPEPGIWRTSRVPFMREIMQALSTESPVESVSLMKGTQIAGTEVLLNTVLYTVDHDPTSMMIVLPTLSMAKRFSRQRLSSSIEIMPTVREKMAEQRSRDSSNTLLEKDFEGGFMILTGAESATGLRSAPIGSLVLDEIDAYPQDVEGEGDPEQLAIKRTQNYKGRRKIYKNSTPTIEGMSRIEKSFARGDQRHYYVPCPHCGEMQRLQWKQVQWNKDLPRDQQPDSAYYACEHHGCVIEEHHKTEMLAKGEWRAHNSTAPAHRRSYHINSLYSPLGWYSWADAVLDWLDAQGDIELLKTFTNTVLAECWKESVNDIEATILQSKAEPYKRGIIPSPALALVASVDTQDNRLEAFVYAVGRADEQWLVDYTVIMGDPGIEQGEIDSPWDELNDYLHQPWQHALGAQINIQGYAVDTGGHYTHDVYNYVRKNKHKGAIAIKGSQDGPVLSRPKKMDINHNGRVMKHGVELYRVGTAVCKSKIYNRYQREAVSGAGAIHFPDWLPFEIFEQLTAEKLVRKYKNGYAVYEWHKRSSSARNEATDCTVYVQAVIEKLGLNRYSPDRWDQIEQSLRVQDLFAQPSQADQQQATIAPAIATPVQSVSNNSGFKEVTAKW